MNREESIVTITKTIWLEYDFDEAVTICHSLPNGIETVTMTAAQAIGTISGITEWLVTFFDSRADRVEHHGITSALWILNQDDRITLVSTRRHGNMKRVEIDFMPQVAIKTAAALAGWLQARPSWIGKYKLPEPARHIHAMCALDCAL